MSDRDRAAGDELEARAELVREPLRQLYAELDSAVREHGPVCEISGRCCRFEEYGHTLFLSSPELALLVADAPPPVRALDEGRTCPWQDARGLCTAREARPLGCRTYFCDPTYQEPGVEVAEEFISRLKKLVETEGWAWDYAPLHRHLRSALEAGWIAFPGVERT